jgi:hypothetical protein
MKDVPNFGANNSAQVRKRRWVPIAWLASGFLVAYAYTFISATASDSENLSGCQAVVSSVTAKHRLPLSVSEPGSPAISCDLGVHFPFLRTYYSVRIYGVLDQREQDAIVGDLQTTHRTANTQKILVEFFAKENWRTWSDPASGRSGGSRGPESPLVKAWID